MPIGVVKAVYRGKVQALVLAALKANELQLPPDKSPQATNKIIRQLYNKPWSVRIQEPYSHGNGVLNYLSRYLTGGPLKAQQMITADHQRIAFSYQDHRDGKTKQLNLAKEEFMRRILLHIPEPGIHTVRHYGLYSSASKGLSQAREILSTLSQTASLPFKKLANCAGNKVRCPCCGLAMVLIYQVYQSWKKGNSYIKSVDRNSRARYVQQNVQADVGNVVPP